MKENIFLFVLLLFFACSADQSNKSNTVDTINKDLKITDELPEFQIYGELAPVGYLDDADTITEKYGFLLKRIAGCEVGEIDLEKIHKENRDALEKMNKKYGDNWRQKFKEETGYELAVNFK